MKTHNSTCGGGAGFNILLRMLPWIIGVPVVPKPMGGVMNLRISEVNRNSDPFRGTWRICL